MICRICGTAADCCDDCYPEAGYCCECGPDNRDDPRMATIGQGTRQRQTPEQYAQEVFETLTACGSDYDSAMREARIALADARADDAETTCPDTFPAEWSS